MASGDNCLPKIHSQKNFSVIPLINLFRFFLFVFKQSHGNSENNTHTFIQYIFMYSVKTNVTRIGIKFIQLLLLLVTESTFVEDCSFI